LAGLETVKCVGYTTDGIPVIGGVWSLSATYGVPLETALVLIYEHGWMVDWINIISDSRKDGANSQRLIARLRNILSPTYGAANLRILCTNACWQ